MKKLIACLLFLLSLPTCASDLLKQIQQTLVDAPVLRGEFVQQKTLQGISKTLNSEGYFVVDKKNKRLLWVTTKPFHHILHINKEEILQKASDGRVLMRINTQIDANIGTISQLFFALFAGDSATLNQFFRYTGQLKDKQWHLELTPIHAGMAQVIRHLSLEGAQNIQNIELSMKAGDKTRINFTNLTPLTTLSADELAAFQ